MSWHKLLPSDSAVRAMDVETLKDAENTTNGAISELSNGISGIGALMAAAGTGEFGVPGDQIANLGWMLQSLGNLISNLVDYKDSLAFQQQQLAAAPAKRGAK